MKGVILGIAPRATIVDITHEIPTGNIRAGAFALAASYRFFPKGTVHLAVVDPGVGSERSAIAVQTASHFFVGPDNGVLSFALAKEKIKTVRRIKNESYFSQPISTTFHGRDVFSPVAARLSKGLPAVKLGPEANDFVRLPWPKPRTSRNQIHGEIIYVDRFGNAITNVEGESLSGRQHAAYDVFVGRRRLCGAGEFYQAVPAGKPVAIVGSSGFLEIAVNSESAAQRFGLRIGDAVTVCSC